MEIYTSTVYWYKKDDAMDISIKSAHEGRIFAPDWNTMVKPWIDGPQDMRAQYEYAFKYRDLMRSSFMKNKQAWLDLFKRDTIVFLCYCNPTDRMHMFCHRILFVALLLIQAEVLGVEVEYRGEILKDGRIKHAMCDDVVFWIQWFKENKHVTSI